MPWNIRCFCPGARQPQAVASVSSETVRASSCSHPPPTKPTELYEEGLPAFGPQECRMRPSTEMDACPTPSWDFLMRLSLSDYFQREGLVRKLKRQSGRVKGWVSAHLQEGAFSECGVMTETLSFPQTHSDHTSKKPAEARCADLSPHPCSPPRNPMTILNQGFLLTGQFCFRAPGNPTCVCLGLRAQMALELKP